MYGNVKYNFGVRLIGERKMKKIISGIMLNLMLIGMLALAFKIQVVRANPRTWTVDDDGPADFHTIQEAIVAADSGDTIYVHNGTYLEHISFGIGKTVTLIGENKYATIIDGLGYGTAVRISRTMDAKVTNFTILNAEIGILLDRTSNITIVDNIITNFSARGPSWKGGICIQDSHENIVVNNTISNTTEYGIYLWDSYNNIVTGNIISGTIPLEPEFYSVGICLDGSSHENIVVNNTISNTTWNGILLNSYNNIVTGNIISGTNPLEPDFSPIGIYLSDNSHDNTILGNVISNSTRGIYASQLAYSNTFAGNIIENLTSYECGINIWGPNNRIIGNTITGMSYVGIQLNSLSSDGLYGHPDACANNIVSGNVISRCTFGINLILAAFSNTIVGNNVSNNGMGILISDSSNNSTVTENFVSNNDYGLLLFSSNDTRVYHNSFIGNTQQVLLSESLNTAWDDGYPSGGNCWSDYGGVDFHSGPYQNEMGSDGIGDTHYTVDADNIDHYPLMEPWRLKATVDIQPDILSLKSKSQWIIVYIELPEGYDVADVIVSTVLLNETVPAELSPTAIGDYDNDGIPDLMVMFNRTAVSELILSEGIMVGNVTLTITGEVYGGTLFQGNDVIRVRMPGDINMDGKVRVDDILIVAQAWGTSPNKPGNPPRWNPIADETEDGQIRVDDVLAVALNFGKTYT
jgi:parallel beta-helix repeat protein